MKQLKGETQLELISAEDILQGRKLIISEDQSLLFKNFKSPDSLYEGKFSIKRQMFVLARVFFSAKTKGFPKVEEKIGKIPKI